MRIRFYSMYNSEDVPEYLRFRWMHQVSRTCSVPACGANVPQSQLTRSRVSDVQHTDLVPSHMSTQASIHVLLPLGAGRAKLVMLLTLVSTDLVSLAGSWSYIPVSTQTMASTIACRVGSQTLQTRVWGWGQGVPGRLRWACLGTVSGLADGHGRSVEWLLFLRVAPLSRLLVDIFHLALDPQPSGLPSAGGTCER